MSTLVPITIEQDGTRYELVRNEQGEALAEDLQFARWLGYERPHEIRRLVDRNAGDLGEVFVTVTKTSEQGGRPGRAYYLTESQALYLAAKSETPRANELLKTMIKVFMLARRGQLADAEQAASPRLRKTGTFQVPFRGMSYTFKVQRAGKVGEQLMGCTKHVLALIGISAEEARLDPEPGEDFCAHEWAHEQERRKHATLTAVQLGLHATDLPGEYGDPHCDVDDLWAVAELESWQQPAPPPGRAEIEELVQRAVRRALSQHARQSQVPMPFAVPRRDLVTSAEMAALLGISRATLYLKLASHPELFDLRERNRWPVTALQPLQQALQIKARGEVPEAGVSEVDLPLGISPTIAPWFRQPATQQLLRPEKLRGSTELYASYVSFCARQGADPITHIGFAKALQRIGLVRVERAAGTFYYAPRRERVQPLHL